MPFRVIAGKYRHRNITFPLDPSIRPTKDRIREAIFSSLGDLSGLNVLDLYAGSGAMGIEALSRNALFATFVDINPLAINSIKTNIKTLDIKDVEILAMSDMDALNIFKNESRQFDIVFLDPPYQQGQYINIINYLIDNSIVHEGSRIITECNYALDLSLIKYKKIKEYRYGEIIVNVLHL